MREPLLHFLLIGATIFVVFELTNDSSFRNANTHVVVSAGRVEQLANVFARTWQRPPTPGELQSLIDDFVLEEIYYRQAIAMGIDRDDTVIRRRLRQKFEFLTDDVAKTIAPTEADLTTYYAANPDLFRHDPTYTFEQVMVDPGLSESERDARVSQLLAALEAGDAPPAFDGLLPVHFQGATKQSVDGLFGPGFSTKLDAVDAGEWLGPIESGLGLHLVRLEQRTGNTLPDFEQVRPFVEIEWANEKRLEARRLMNEHLLSQYDVVIEWPVQ